MPILVDSELVLYGFVGDNLWDEGFTDREVLDALTEVGRDTDIVVRVNSGGGYTSHGKAIFNALKAHRGRVTVSVDGIAASAASLLAMAGDEIIMRTGSLMMIHDPAALTAGTSADHQKSIEWLEAEAAGCASIYAERTGKPAEDMRAIMLAETWMTAEEAVAAGFADKADSQSAESVSAFDYRIYDHAPGALTALAKKRSWSLSKELKADPSAAPRQTKENPMTDKPAGEPAKTHTQADLDAAASASKLSATAAANANAAEIVTICAAAGVPAMAANLIKEGATPEQAKARVDGAKDIRAAVSLAHKSCSAIEESLADTFIAAGTSLEGVRADLFQRMASAQSPEIKSGHQAGTGSDAAELDSVVGKIVSMVRPQATEKRSA
jgi:ATP-dependent protease ClpP protease subunit